MASIRSGESEALVSPRFCQFAKSLDVEALISYITQFLGWAIKIPKQKCVNQMSEFWEPSPEVDSGS